jgi:hypothetical protein
MRGRDELKENLCTAPVGHSESNSKQRQALEGRSILHGAFSSIPCDSHQPSQPRRPENPIARSCFDHVKLEGWQVTTSVVGNGRQQRPVKGQTRNSVSQKYGPRAPVRAERD